MSTVNPQTVKFGEQSGGVPAKSSFLQDPEKWKDVAYMRTIPKPEYAFPKFMPKATRDLSKSLGLHASAVSRIEANIANWMVRKYTTKMGLCGILTGNLTWRTLIGTGKWILPEVLCLYSFCLSNVLKMLYFRAYRFYVTVLLFDDKSSLVRTIMENYCYFYYQLYIIRNMFSLV